MRRLSPGDAPRIVKLPLSSLTRAHSDKGRFGSTPVAIPDPLSEISSSTPRSARTSSIRTCVALPCLTALAVASETSCMISCCMDLGTSRFGGSRVASIRQSHCSLRSSARPGSAWWSGASSYWWTERWSSTYCRMRCCKLKTSVFTSSHVRLGFPGNGFGDELEFQAGGSEILQDTVMQVAREPRALFSARRLGCLLHQRQTSQFRSESHSDDFSERTAFVWMTGRIDDENPPAIPHAGECRRAGIFEWRADFRPQLRQVAENSSHFGVDDRSAFRLGRD